MLRNKTTQVISQRRPDCTYLQQDLTSWKEARLYLLTAGSDLMKEARLYFLTAGSDLMKEARLYLLTAGSDLMKEARLYLLVVGSDLMKEVQLYLLAVGTVLTCSRDCPSWWGSRYQDPWCWGAQPALPRVCQRLWERASTVPRSLPVTGPHWTRTSADSQRFGKNSFSVRDRPWENR